ncbi:MAG: tetratricopeptide repeat protein [Planctomycetota bacterium]|nr:MAG: tetratricopeptide repeat protein [Planctomycetota bacterium]
MSEIPSIERTAFGKGWDLPICALLVLATFTAYWPVHRYSFVDYDDHQYVTDNQHVKDGLTRDGIIWAFTTGHASNWHPLTWLSHMLDCQLFGADPGRHHLTSLLIHTISSIVLFAVFKKMTGEVWLSGFVAAAFALHPLHVESVAWIAERKDVLSGLFWMLTMAVYLRYARQRRIGWYVATILVFALGLMAKPMLVTLPFVLLLLDYWPLERLGRDNAVRLVVEKTPLFILSAISSVITFVAQRSGGAVIEMEEVSIGIRAANALISYFVYISKMFWPSRLAVFYVYALDKSLLWLAVLAAFLVVGISILVVALAARYRYVFVGWFWYIGTLVPVIGLVQVGTQARADRYTYLPSIGISIIVAWGAAEMPGKWRYSKVVLAISAAVVMAAMLLCARTQVHHWQDSLTLFRHAVEVTRGSYVGHAGLGKALHARGKLDEAVRQYRQALQIKPNYTIARYNLANALSRQGKKDEAIEHYREVLQTDPNNARAHNNLGNALSGQRKIDEAIIHYRRAMEIEPDNPKVHNNLGSALAIQGNFGEAIGCFRSALQLKANDAEAWYNLGYVFELQGRLDEAIDHYRRALEIKPDKANAKERLEAVLNQKQADR